MLKRPKNISVDGRYSNSLKGSLRFRLSFVVLSIFLAIWISADVRAFELNEKVNYGLDSGAHELDVTVPVHSTTFNLAEDTNKNPFGPNVPEPAPEKEPGSDEDEKEDSLDDEWYNYYAVATLHEISVEKNQSFHLTRGIQNRTVRPLFMLYNSWKNFIL